MPARKCAGPDENISAGELDGGGSAAAGRLDHHGRAECAVRGDGDRTQIAVEPAEQQEGAIRSYKHMENRSGITERDAAVGYHAAALDQRCFMHKRARRSTDGEEMAAIPSAGERRVR